MKYNITFYILSLLCLTGSKFYSGLSTMKPLDTAFYNASKAHNVDLKLLRALCWVESNHKTKARRILDKNRPSYGVCQIQLRTAQHFGFQGSTKELMDMNTNTYYAAKILKYWLVKSKYNWKRAVNAYNRGHLTKATLTKYVMKIIIAKMENR